LRPWPPTGPRSLRAAWSRGDIHERWAMTPDLRAHAFARMGILAVVVVVGSCSATTNPTVAPTTTQLSPSAGRPSTMPTMLAATILPSSTFAAVPACARDGATAFPGVVELRPDGWFDQTPDGAVLTDFPHTVGRVYAEEPVERPPYEGPGRLVLYETFPASDEYFKTRVEQSRQRGGKAVAAGVCGEATEVWSDESSGELIVGWTDRGKSDVLVANRADYTVAELVDAAESVYDCCG
jgi:hypothetical protein